MQSAAPWRAAVGLLVALALLLQTLWLPFHLASEHHHVPGLEPVRTCSCGAHLEPGADEHRDDGPAPEPPHSALDHKDPKQRPAEDGLDGVPPLLALPPGVWRPVAGLGTAAAAPKLLAHVCAAARAAPAQPRAPPAA
ncbi:MAG: hypothetical protein JNK49_03250 [Planctomycetes bacterium]|nr:hypothetical protein [Planctomycetota bacterium]